MAPSGALVAAGALAGVGVLVILARKKAVAKKPPPDPCDALKSVDDTAYQACKAASALGDIIGGIGDLLGDNFAEIRAQFKADDDANKALNGAIAIPVTAEMQMCLGWNPNRFGGSVVQFANGCQPFDKAPGWSKCKPGTKSMRRDASDVVDYSRNATAGDPQQPQAPIIFRADWSQLGTGKIDVTQEGGSTVYTGDPASGVLGFGKVTNCYGKPFAMPAPEGGVSGYYRGKPFVCGGATRPTFDGGDAPTCQGGQVSGGGHGQSQGQFEHDVCAGGGPNPPPGYTYVAPTPTVPGHWERTRKGQTGQPVPCSTTITTQWNGPMALLLDGEIA